MEGGEAGRMVMRMADLTHPHTPTPTHTHTHTHTHAHLGGVVAEARLLQHQGGVGEEPIVAAQLLRRHEACARVGGWGGGSMVLPRQW
jgi:hypothetical protein